MLGKFDERGLTAFISTMPLDSFPIVQKIAALKVTLVRFRYV